MAFKSAAIVTETDALVAYARQCDFFSPAISDRPLQPPGPETKKNLTELIVDEIVPRLKTMHHNLTPADQRPPIGALEIAEFGALAMGNDEASVAAYFEKMHALGHSLDSLFLDLLAPTARRLGELWEEDVCDFIDVTLGLARLQEVLRIFGCAEASTRCERRQRALLATAPSEAHGFGIELVASFMRAASWDVELLKGVSIEENVEAVAGDWYATYGVALAAEAGLDTVAQLICAVRRASRNRSIAVIVGGRVFNSNPQLAIQVGADATAPDAPTATLLAKKLLMRQIATGGAVSFEDDGA
ncbi:MAG: cobalamin-dependent protein [Methylocystis sp.]